MHMKKHVLYIICVLFAMTARGGRVIYLQLDPEANRQRIHYISEISPVDSAHALKEFVIVYRVISIKPLSNIRLPQFERLYEIECRDDASAERLMLELNARPWVSFAEMAPE